MFSEAGVEFNFGHGIVEILDPADKFCLDNFQTIISEFVLEIGGIPAFVS